MSTGKTLVKCPIVSCVHNLAHCCNLSEITLEYDTTCLCLNIRPLKPGDNLITLLNRQTEIKYPKGSQQ